MTLEEDVLELQGQVAGQNKDRPGLLTRVDRLEWFVKGLIALAGMGLAWKVLDIVGAVIAQHALRP